MPDSLSIPESAISQGAYSRRIGDLEAEIASEPRRKGDGSTVEHDLRERIKELNCFYRIAQLVEEYGRNTDAILQGVVEILPLSWQYPDIARARLILEGREYANTGFGMSQWKQRADIRVHGERVGSIEVYYLAEKEQADEGPFLKEERLLLDAIAERLGHVVERIRTEQQLEVERNSLRQANNALREVLGRIGEEKREIRDSVQTNINNIVMPILNALEGEIHQQQKGYVTLLRRNLEEISSPFADRLSKDFMGLTPVELSICDMIKRGLSTKEIAVLRHISTATVSRHREHIRRKLGLANEKVNLSTYLQTFMFSSGGASQDSISRFQS